MVASLLFLILLTVSAINPNFATLQNFRDLLIQSAPAIIVSCGMTFVILTGEIDISVGSLLGLLGAIMGILSSPQHQGLPVPLVIAATLLAGSAIGLLNGLLITVGRVPSIIATLGMLTILRGITDFAMAGAWITDLPLNLRTLGTGTLLGLPISLCVAATVVLASLFLSHRTRLGLRIYAVGGNPTAAANARVSSTRIKLITFTLLGFLTAVAALVMIPQQFVIESGIGAGFELVVITAVVVGGTSTRGGTGTIFGTILAALLLGSIRTTLLFLNLGDMATYWERAIQGAFILIAVLAEHASRNRARAGAPA